MNQYILLRAILYIFLSFCMTWQAKAATAPAASGADRDRITATLTDYMQGTANGEPAKLKQAFHPDFKLYAVTEDNELLIRSGEQYIAAIKPGEKIKRIGRIVSIDV